jgi:hypothetical protein
MAWALRDHLNRKDSSPLVTARRPQIAASIRSSADVHFLP